MQRWSIIRARTGEILGSAIGSYLDAAAFREDFIIQHPLQFFVVLPQGQTLQAVLQSERTT